MPNFMKKELTAQNRVQLGIVVVNSLLLIVFLALDREVFGTSLIFATVEVRRSVLLLAIFVIGALVGWDLKSWVSSKKSEELGPPNY